MNKTVRLEVFSTDRVGMTHDLVEVFYRHGVNIIALEVFPNRMLIKFHGIGEERLINLIADLKHFRGVEHVKKIYLLNHEINERKLQGTIESIQKGIVTVNHINVIEVFNQAALSYFKLNKEDIINKKFESFFKGDEQFLELVKSGHDFEQMKLSLRGKMLLVSLKHIRDDWNNHQGMILTLEDYSEVLRTAQVILNEYDSSFEHIIGVSPAMHAVKHTISAVGPTDSSVLLRGESGTGKELFAKAIHDVSLRKDKAFVAINCASLPETLIESELFGYEKGSFTGANRSHDGFFKQADGGTLFLDEIGDLPLSMQAKLLRVLQDGLVRKIGSQREEKVDIRLIAATNRKLERMIESGHFREDLYYRINVMPIFIPPLRNRLEDLPHLVQFFIQKFNHKLNKNITSISSDYLKALNERQWLGNVRELQNYVERSMLLVTGNVLEPMRYSLDKEEGMIETPHVYGIKNQSLKETVAAYEKEILKKVLSEETSIRQAAKHLGLSHTGLIKKMKKYDM